MFALYILLFFVLYLVNCLHCKNLLSYYTGKNWSFHLNLWRWNTDVKYETLDKKSHDILMKEGAIV